MSYRHRNNLKPHRKRSGFTQAELAFLLGLKDHSAISKFEHGEREPDFRMAVAYHAVFDRGLPELFLQVHREVRAEIGKRAERLSEVIGGGPKSAKVAYKLQKLARLKETDGEHVPTV